MDKRVTCSFLFALLLLATTKARAEQMFPPSNISDCNANTFLAWAGPGTDVYCKVLPVPPPPPPPPAAPPPVSPPPQQETNQFWEGPGGGILASGGGDNNGTGGE